LKIAYAENGVRERRPRRYRAEAAEGRSSRRSAWSGAGARRGAERARGRRRRTRSRAQITPEQQAAIAAETKKIYDDVLETYRKLGAKLEPLDVPADLTQMTNAIGFLLEVESAASFDDATRSGDINQLQNPNGSRSSWPNTFRQSRFVPAVEYIRAMRIRTLLQRQADDFFSKFDVLLEPGTGGTLGMTNLTGHPAMAVKCGFTNTPGYATGQPRVLMLTGKLYDEATVARVALAFEQATDWKDKHPTLAT
jgi:Asp-tRNA(Asn)/Glu-tRNA(Gln) amidotransferase A subunit family amidase